MRAIVKRTPAAVTVDFGAIPRESADELYRTIIVGVERAFRDPTIQKEFERWKAARLNKENTNEKETAQASH